MGLYNLFTIVLRTGWKRWIVPNICIFCENKPRSFLLWIISSSFTLLILCFQRKLLTLTKQSVTITKLTSTIIFIYTSPYVKTFVEIYNSIKITLWRVHKPIKVAECTYSAPSFWCRYLCFKIHLFLAMFVDKIIYWLKNNMNIQTPSQGSCYWEGLCLFSRDTILKFSLAILFRKLIMLLLSQPAPATSYENYKE